MVEEARLESVYTCQRVSRVRIPVSPPSPAEAGYGGRSPQVACEGGAPQKGVIPNKDLIFVGYFYLPPKRARADKVRR